MLTVSEHLTDIKNTLRRLQDLLVTGGRLYLSHGNYYCWNGHHLPPRTISEYDEADPQHCAVADWNHVGNLVKNDESAQEYLNCIRLHELASMLKELFRIDTWRFDESKKDRGGGRLTDPIRRQFPEFYLEELTTEMAYFVCTKTQDSHAWRPEATRS